MNQPDHGDSQTENRRESEFPPFIAFFASYLLAFFLFCFLVIDFLSAPEAKQISINHLWMIGVVALLLLCPVFDRLSVGKFLTLERTIKKEQNLREKEQERTEKLTTQLISMSNAIMTSNQTVSIYNNIGPAQATEQDILRKRREEEQFHRESRPFDDVSKLERGTSYFAMESAMETSERFKDVEDYVIINLPEKYGIRPSDISTNIKIIDPTPLARSFSSRIFDAYSAVRGIETFFEVKYIRTLKNLWRRQDALSREINDRLLVCREYATRRNADFKLVFVIAYDSYNSDHKMDHREVALYDRFREEIDEGVLTLDLIPVSIGKNGER